MLWNKGCHRFFFLVIVGLFCCHFGGVDANNCPDVCDCYKNQHEQSVWNCSGLSNANMLWQYPDADTLGFDVKHLIIRQSRINFQDNFSHLFPNLDILELPSNRVIHCSKSSVWLLEWTSKLKDADSILCSSPRPLNGTNLLKALNLIQDVDSQCPKNCTCELSHVPKDDQYGITIHINCTNLGLTELPKVLPANVTIHLHLSGNQIEDLDGVVSNPSYGRVTTLFLNNNHIKSIDGLVNSKWFRQFSLLSLEGNHLQELPTQALTNGFTHQDINGFRMFLGKNPWKCDCSTLPHFQQFIAKHKQLVKDVSNVTCGPEEGINAGKKIVSVELSSICADPDEYSKVNLMDVLNVVLALLTIVTIGKLLYDYYAYKKTGRLPWLATKMP